MTGPPSDRRYTRSHVWAMPGPEGNVRVGLTHVPGGILGDAVSVELPPAGAEVESGEPIGLVESSITVFEILSPLAGTVSGVNPGVENFPQQVTRDPYGEGWLLEIRTAGPGVIDSLLKPEEYERYAGEG